MHELSIAMSIVDIAADYAARDNAKCVTEIEIEVGTLAGVVIDALDFAMEAASISNADSVIFMLGGIYHIVAGFNSSYTFTKAELSTLVAGANFMQITAYRWDATVSNGKTYYFVNETVVTEPVTIK